MSKELTLEKETTKLEKFLIKEGREDFVHEVRRSSKSELDAKILNLAKHRQEIQTTKANDEELQKAKDNKSALEAPYRDQLKMNEKLTRFTALVMSEEGME